MNRLYQQWLWPALLLPLGGYPTSGSTKRFRIRKLLCACVCLPWDFWPPVLTLKNNSEPVYYTSVMPAVGWLTVRACGKFNVAIFSIIKVINETSHYGACLYHFQWPCFNFESYNHVTSWKFSVHIKFSWNLVWCRPHHSIYTCISLLLTFACIQGRYVSCFLIWQKL